MPRLTGPHSTALSTSSICSGSVVQSGVAPSRTASNRDFCTNSSLRWSRSASQRCGLESGWAGWDGVEPDGWSWRLLLLITSPGSPGRTAGRAVASWLARYNYYSTHTTLLLSNVTFTYYHFTQSSAIRSVGIIRNKATNQARESNKQSFSNIRIAIEFYSW